MRRNVLPSSWDVKVGVTGMKVNEGGSKKTRKEKIYSGRKRRRSTDTCVQVSFACFARCWSEYQDLRSCRFVRTWHLHETPASAYDFSCTSRSNFLDENYITELRGRGTQLRTGAAARIATATRVRPTGAVAPTTLRGRNIGRQHGRIVPAGEIHSRRFCQLRSSSCRVWIISRLSVTSCTMWSPSR